MTTQTTTTRPWLRRGVRILLALLLVGVLLWGAMFLRATVLRPRAAQQEAADALALAEADLDALAQEDAAALDPELGAPVGSTRTLQCALEPSDRGWFVADHQQRCVVHEVEVRVVPQDLADPAARSGALLEDEAGWVQEAGPLVLAGTDCTIVGEASAPADEQLEVMTPEVHRAALLVDDLDGVEGCLDPDAPSSRALDSASRELASTPVPADASGQRLLVIVRQELITNTSLGCLPLPLFCEPPVSSVQMPDAG